MLRVFHMGEECADYYARDLTTSVDFLVACQYIYKNMFSSGYIKKNMKNIASATGDCSLVRRFCSPKVRKSEIKGSSFRRFCSPKVRKSDNDIDSFLL